MTLLVETPHMEQTLATLATLRVRPWNSTSRLWSTPALEVDRWAARALDVRGCTRERAEVEASRELGAAGGVATPDEGGESPARGEAVTGQLRAPLPDLLPLLRGAQVVERQLRREVDATWSGLDEARRGW